MLPNLNTRRSSLTRLDIAIRIRDAVLPALNDRKRFKLRSNGPCYVWQCEAFQVASIVAPNYSSFEVWPARYKSGLSPQPDLMDKTLNLYRKSCGTHDLATFRRGQWEVDLLRHVGAPLGLLTIHVC